MSDEQKEKEVITKILNEPVSVAETTDGWIFGFSLGILEELTRQAEEHPKNKAIIFVRSKRKMQ